MGQSVPYTDDQLEPEFQKALYKGGAISLLTAREYDQESGLYFYRARYYNPEIGRFVSVDPLGLAGGINLYSYVSNNPINYLDPEGTIVIADDVAIAIVIGGSALAISLATPQGQEMLAENIRHVKDVIEGLIDHAQEHVDKCHNSSPEDPNQHKWRKEIKAALDRAKKMAQKRLKGKTRENIIKVIERIQNSI
jgi:RHS repeat-associated protein